MTCYTLCVLLYFYAVLWNDFLLFNIQLFEATILLEEFVTSAGISMGKHLQGVVFPYSEKLDCNHIDKLLNV